jgi:hypothetical protein
MILTGKNKPEFTGNRLKTTVISALPIGIVSIVMNSSEPKKDFASLPSLIDAILLLLKLSACKYFNNYL